MSLPVVNTDEILAQAEAQELYLALIRQLNKDLRLANIDHSFKENLTVTELKLGFVQFLNQLIQHKFDAYLKLLYIVDVPEHQLKNIKETSLSDLVPKVAFIILKREWQKVWFRSKY